MIIKKKVKKKRKGGYCQKGLRLKTKTDQQLKALFQFHLRSRSVRKTRDEVIEFAESIGLSFKEVNKWLWDREQVDKSVQKTKTSTVFSAGPVKLFQVIGLDGKETASSKLFATERF